MSRKRVLGPLSVVLLMFPLASCTSVSPSAATIPATAASRNTDSVLSICGYGLLDVADDWQVAFLDYGAASSTGTELPALRALQEVADRLDKFKEPCSRERMVGNSELELCAILADLLESAPQALSDLFTKKLVAWDEGRYNAAAAVTSEISSELGIIRGATSAGC